ncbi:PDR/VanB family oxidoreductase [Arthrobacter sp. StoSoilB20]|uniref:PDR/VanB family oxidoreductase n=1 Tax=Arthrobacter sp. StoSoilB20 TaxID=2830995 RepID=UPI001CC6AB3C|nr:PDR/VanB family oxidoreductase [Arthrobacter sp. StoSoilB20]BCW58651.1 ferredoxin [Arthrobacter sp. StoSoilB20]
MFTKENSDPYALQTRLLVTAKKHFADGVVSLNLAHPAGRRLPDWTPGSHIDVVLPSGINRQYSLCGDRWDAHNYRIAVLHETDGRGGSDFIHHGLTEGMTFAIGGPRNNFRLVPSEKYLFIAGGIGITPMLPMIQAAHMMGAEWRLLYFGRSRRTMAFLDELAAYGDRVMIMPKDQVGPCSASELIGPASADTKVYVCGPQRLLAAVERHCADWPPGLLRLEHFAAKSHGAPIRDVSFYVELARAGITVTVPPEVSVLEAIQRAGVRMLTSCREGTCGTCEVTVLDGQPDHRDSILSDADRAAGNCMFPCVSRSCGDRLVLDV